MRGHSLQELSRVSPPADSLWLSGGNQELFRTDVQKRKIITPPLTFLVSKLTWMPVKGKIIFVEQ